LGSRLCGAEPMWIWVALRWRVARHARELELAHFVTGLRVVGREFEEHQVARDAVHDFAFLRDPHEVRDAAAQKKEDWTVKPEQAEHEQAKEEDQETEGDREEDALPPR